ncbi:MAG: lysophospholipid acyltransferase family protein [Candidatus Puniceispirillum sp.]
MNEQTNIAVAEKHPVFSFADAEMGPLSNRIIRSLERATGQPKISRLYFDYVSENLHPSRFWSDALDRLAISINLQREQNAQIPETGRVVAVSNHPYGVIDGLVLCALMAEVREDYKIITHRVLRQAPAVMDKILPIDFDETEAALANNLQVRSDAMAHLKNDGAIIIFPAGAISLAPHLFGNAYDLEWKTFAAKLATQKNTTTVPFYFDGRNSVLYQMARRISQTLGYSLMFREICKLMGTSVNITMRNPIDSDMLKALGNRTLATDYMRRKTYGMS